MQESCIIEPRCREQFQIAQATPAYQRVVRQIPEVFVGSPGRLHGLVSAVAPAMAEAFAAQNTPLPPWRKQLSMLTKWSLKGLQQQPPAVAAQPRRSIPAFARDLQALQVCSDPLLPAHAGLKIDVAHGCSLALSDVRLSPRALISYAQFSTENIRRAMHQDASESTGSSQQVYWFATRHWCNVTRMCACAASAR